MKQFIKDHLSESVIQTIRFSKSRAMQQYHETMGSKELIQELKNIYRKTIGVDLNLKNPKRYTEKIQWMKIFGVDKTMADLADKITVRKWVEKRIGGEYLIPLLGVWNSVSEVDFSELPNSFVLKANNASSANFIVKEKAAIDIKLARKTMDRWMKQKFWFQSFEFQYRAIEPKIYAEKFMIDNACNDLLDYKFFCFDGEPIYVQVDGTRYTEHRRSVFDLHWNMTDIKILDYPPLKRSVLRPACFDEMIAIVKTLAKGFPHVRVDLYAVDRHPYFGEMTFSPGGGFERMCPDKYDYVFGNMWTLPAYDEKGLSLGLSRIV